MEEQFVKLIHDEEVYLSDHGAKQVSNYNPLVSSNSERVIFYRCLFRVNVPERNEVEVIMEEYARRADAMGYHVDYDLSLTDGKLMLSYSARLPR